MNEGTVGWVHLAADILHLVAAGAWMLETRTGKLANDPSGPSLRVLPR